MIFLLLDDDFEILADLNLNILTLKLRPKLQLFYQYNSIIKVLNVFFPIFLQLIIIF